MKLESESGDVINEETKSTTFFCIQRTNIIPETNVRASYPLDNQLNFYKEEYGQHKGYVLLERDQEYLFNTPSGYEHIARFTPAGGGTPLEVPLTYQTAEKRIDFDMPPAWFQAEGLYQLELITKIPQNDNTTANPGSGSSFNQGGSGPSGEYWISPPIANMPVSFTERVLLTLVFRVSHYPTFHNKMQAVQDGLTFSGTNNQGMVLVYQINVDEPLETYETTGYGQTPPLVKVASNLTQTDWYNNSGIRDIYDIYNNGTDGFGCAFQITWRAEDEFGGTPPTESSRVINNGGYTGLTDDYFATGSVPDVLWNQSAYIEYSTVFVIAGDIHDLYVCGHGDGGSIRGCYEEEDDDGSQIEWYFDPPTSGASGAFWSQIDDNHNIHQVPHGTYPVKLQYALPGLDVITSEISVELNY